MRLVLAEDSVLLREGLVRLLEESGMEVLAQVGDAEALLAAVEEHIPDVVITDIKMPPTLTDEGVRAAEIIRARFASIGVLVLSQFVEPRYAVELMLSGGGIGYLLKDRVMEVQELTDALRRIADGGTVVDPDVVTNLLRRGREQDRVALLSNREREVLALMAQGLSNRAIADTLFLSPKTLETHVANIFSKLDLPPTSEEHRRVAAVLRYLRT